MDDTAKVGVFLLVSALLVCGVGGALWLLPGKNSPPEDDSDLLDYCPHCGHVAIPSYRKNGSGLIELLLWLFFLVPGIIYSIWRKSTERMVCPKCEQAGTIPLDSPKAKAALQKS